MNRRSFLRTGIAGGAALAGTSCTQPVQQPAEAPASTTVVAFELDEKTIPELARDLESGRYSTRSLAEKYYVRIDQIDRNGPAVNSVIELNPDTMDIAGQLDRERKNGRVRGPLHGMPILIKDNIATGDKMKTTAGSLALATSVPPEDAAVAKRLRDAGALLLGKTNLSEWANFRSNGSTSGWSGRGGQTHNPYALDRNPCGSSSGSGVAVAASLCAAAIGTETDGSILCPSGVNGVVGLKPTVGLVSRFGIIPISETQDTAGPMARTVRDVAIILGAIAGVDRRDQRTAAAARHVQKDYTRFLDPSGLKGARIGVVRNSFTRHTGANKLIDGALDVLKKQGAVLVDPANIPTARKWNEAENTLLLYEFKAGINAYLAWLGPKSPVRTLKDLIAFNEKNRDKEMPYFGQETFIEAEAKGPLTERAYRTSGGRGASSGSRARHRRGAAPAPAGRSGGAHQRSGVDDRLGGRRSYAGKQLGPRRRGWLSEHHRARRLCDGAAGGALVFRNGVVGAGAAAAGLRLRAGHQSAPQTGLPTERGNPGLREAMGSGMFAAG